MPTRKSPALYRPKYDAKNASMSTFDGGDIEEETKQSQTLSPKKHVVAPEAQKKSKRSARKSSVLQAAKPASLAVASGEKPNPLLRKKVAFNPRIEAWMDNKVFKNVEDFVMGQIVSENKGSFQVMWTDSMFQKHEPRLLDYCDVVRGYIQAQKLQSDEPSIDSDLEEAEEAEEMKEFRSDMNLIETFDDSENTTNMRFELDESMQKPYDLYKHSGKVPHYLRGNETYVRLESASLFEESELSAFLSYLPISYWKDVTRHTNDYAETHGMVGDFTLEDIFDFLGILFYMALIGKGGYENYWGLQDEQVVFGDDAHRYCLSRVMCLSKFKKLRRCIMFSTVNGNPAAPKNQLFRVQELIDILRATFVKHVVIGREISGDEASFAFRGTYGRALIFYNPTKPGGKYHFRLYVICDATNWLCLNFKIHCNQDVEQYLSGSQMNEDDQNDFCESIRSVQPLRKNVLQLCQPLFGKGRVLNIDNYYTSPQLMDQLMSRGLYCRGTVRKNRKHVPVIARFTVQERAMSRGYCKFAVRADKKMLCASWNDGNEVSIMSTADGTTMATVERRMGARREPIPAPEAIKNYNRYMQGVDRLDQLRACFSLTDGHSFKYWYRKLAFGLIDMARVNAYQARKSILEHSNAWKSQREPHRHFVRQLTRQLLAKKWRSFLPTPIQTQLDQSPAVRSVCSHVDSSVPFPKQRRKRECIVCKWEGRGEKSNTIYCVNHMVSLCNKKWETQYLAHRCPNTDFTCWEKYHQFYQPQGLYSSVGSRTRASSHLYKLSKQCE